MKPASVILPRAEEAKSKIGRVNDILLAYKAKIEEIRDSGLSLKKQDGLIKEVQDLTTAAMSGVREELKTINDELASEKKYWQSSAFLMSYLPVSNKAELIAEAKLMSTDLLSLHIDHARESGELGRLHILMAALNSRDAKPENWTPPDISKISVTGQPEVLKAIASAKANYDLASIAMREVMGATAESLARAKLTVGHEAVEVK